MERWTEKLATLKEQSIPIPISSPLYLFLSIYNKTKHECFIEYMWGAKELLKYLSPITYPIDKYPEILNPNFKVPSLLSGYESSELATLLEPYEKYHDMDKYLRANVIASNAIYFVMSKEIICENY